VAEYAEPHDNHFAILARGGCVKFKKAEGHESKFTRALVTLRLALMPRLAGLPDDLASSLSVLVELDAELLTHPIGDTLYEWPKPLVIGASLFDILLSGLYK
jgi:hypothetical protein